MAVKPSSSAYAGGKAMGVAPLVRKRYFIFIKKYNIFLQKVFSLLSFPVFLYFGKIPLTVFSGTAETSVHHVLS